jgi:hypothetical protein
VSRSNEEVLKLGQDRDHSRQADERRTLQINTVTTGHAAYLSARFCHDTSESEAKVPSVCCRVSVPVSDGLRESSCNCEKDNNG